MLQGTSKIVLTLEILNYNVFHCKDCRPHVQFSPKGPNSLARLVPCALSATWRCTSGSNITYLALLMRVNENNHIVETFLMMSRFCSCFILR